MKTADNIQHMLTEHTDKRDVAEIFRDRMALLIAQKGFNLSRFSKSIGIDRSALSQFLAPGSTRLPRAETLCAIARTCGVSLDWLMGLIANDTFGEDAAPMLEVERVTDDTGSRMIAEWHREAMGYKIRYVPSALPDLLRTEAVRSFEFNAHNRDEREARDQLAKDQLTYSRRPETDMEVCMPLQRLQQFAKGQGIWRGLPVHVRKEQLEHMSSLIDELYPTFRLFLYNGREAYAAPYTLFGPLRAAVYLGNMYLVVNSVEHIRALAGHFDQLIRIASFGPDRASEFITALTAELPEH
ncbi:helix-turn-helix domain-containing protein [Hoeflea sp. TYP-13]|uniref:helix-turn-helix domain-containing protein n=1 Tax=Hoeflea sp. TYP-13 TaxID=3230023 RepID=UPI0034C68B4B